MENRSIFLTILKQFLLWSVLFSALFVLIIIFTIDYNIPQQQVALELDVQNKIKSFLP